MKRELKIEFFKPYELKVEWQESARERFERMQAQRPAVPSAASINAKKALILDLLLSILAKHKQGAEVETFAKILAFLQGGAK